MATIIAICSWDSQRSDTEPPRQQKLWYNPENNLTQRDYNENNLGWKEVGMITQPYNAQRRACFLDKDLPEIVKHHVKSGVILHGEIWRL